MSSTITVHNLIVSICWVLGIGLAIADVFFPPALAAPSIAFVGIAVTLFIKGRLDRLGAEWVTAYEAGREVARLRQTR